jgi:hypothetical protein
VTSNFLKEGVKQKTMERIRKGIYEMIKRRRIYGYSKI